MVDAKAGQRVTYVYRRTEDIAREPTAPYVLRESETEPEHYARFDPSRCGSMSGYWQHRRHGQSQCPRCDQAQAKHGAALRANKKGGGRSDGL